MMKSMRCIISLSLCLAVVAATAAFAAEMSAGSKVDRAVAVLHPTEGNRAAGTVVFTQVGDKVRIVSARRLA